MLRRACLHLLLFGCHSVLNETVFRVHNPSRVNPRRHWPFRHPRRNRVGGFGTTAPSDWPLIELELRGKDQRVGGDETNPMVPNFRVLGHQVISEVRSMTQNHRIPFSPIERRLIKLEPRYKDQDVYLAPWHTFWYLEGIHWPFSWSKVKGHIRSSEVSDLAWPLTEGNLIWNHICAKWMSNSKSARKTTLESPKKQKSHPRSPEVIELTWPPSGRDLIGNHGGHILSPVFMFLIIENQETRASSALIRH